MRRQRNAGNVTSMLFLYLGDFEMCQTLRYVLEH